VLELHPEFQALIEAFRSAYDELDIFVAAVSPFIDILAAYMNLDDAYKMAKAMREARAQDTNTIKRLIGSFLPIDPIKNPLTPAITPDSKANRGWVHVGTAAALVPLKDKEVFDANPL